MTRPVRTVEDFVVKDGKIEGQAEADGVGGLHLGLGYVKGLLVGVLSFVSHG